MRATDGLQTTINLGPVHRVDRPSRCSCRWGCPCPCRPRTSTSPTRSRRRPSGRPSDPARLFRALIEKADQELVLQNRRGKAGAGLQRRGTRPFTFETTFGEVTVQRSRISHKHDDTIEVPSARAWETSHQLHITRNLRDTVCDQFSDRSAGESRAEVCRNAGMRTCSGSSTIIDIVHQEGERLVPRNVSEAAGPGRSVRGPVGLARPRCCRPRRPDRVQSMTTCRWTTRKKPSSVGTGPGRVDSNGLPGCEPAFPVAKDQPRAGG